MALENDKALLSAVADLAEQVAEVIHVHTFHPVQGRVWTALLVAGEPLQVEQVAELLDAPFDEVEAALEEIVEFGAALREGERYRAETDPLKVAAQFIQERELPLFEETEEALRFACDRLKKSDAPNAHKATERLADLARSTALLRKVLSTLTKGGRLELDKLLR